MLFIELTDTQANGKEWTKMDEDTLSAKFSALMRTGLIHCQLFNIGKDPLLRQISSFNSLSLPCYRQWRWSSLARSSRKGVSDK